MSAQSQDWVRAPTVAPTLQRNTNQAIHDEPELSELLAVGFFDEVSPVGLSRFRLILSVLPGFFLSALGLLLLIRQRDADLFDLFRQALWIAVVGVLLRRAAAEVAAHPRRLFSATSCAASW